MTTGEIEVADEIFAFGGFGDVRDGKYKGDRVSIKTAMIPSQKDLEKTRKVRIDEIFVPTRRAVSTVQLQRFYREVALWSTLSHLNILGPGQRGETAIHHCVRVDGGWEH